MPNFLKDNQDLRFYLKKGIDWNELVPLLEAEIGPEGDFKSVGEAQSFYGEIAEMVGQFAAEEIAPRSLGIDQQGVRLVDGEVSFPKELDEIFLKIKDLELHGLCLPRGLSGMNAPFISYLINTELLARADVSVMAHHGFHGGMALAMLMLSIREGTTTITEDGHVVNTRFAEAIDEIRRGEAWGCMDITEPDAGSDMAALRATAHKDSDGLWLLNGQKIFITSGHGKYHFVVARTEGAAEGLAGLSMFLVETYRQDSHGKRERVARLDRVEEKMGHHGSATVAVTFEDAPAHLVGKVGEGFAYMLVLMNNARLGVGFEAIGLCEAAYRLAVDYAAERRSMGKSLDQHELIAEYLERMRSDIVALRALAMYGAFHQEMALRLEWQRKANGQLAVGRRIKKHKQEARRVTPLLKFWASERAVTMARQAVQILGGAGYMREYGAEKLLRDAMVLPIYEGTSQIQALMAMKDALGGILKNPQAFVKRVAQTRFRAVSSRDPLERRVARLQSISQSTQNFLLSRTVGAKVKGLGSVPVSEWPRHLLKNWDPKRDFALAMLHAERLAQLLSDEATAEALLAQTRRFPERREALEAFLEYAEPRCRYLHDEATSTGQHLLDRLAQDAEGQLKAG